MRKNIEHYIIDTLFLDLLDESQDCKEKILEKLLFIKGKKGKQKSFIFKKYSYCNIKGHKKEDCYFLYPNKALKAWRIKKK